MDREPAVAGRFYPGEAARLAHDVAEMLGVAASTGPALGVLAPHAGYVYSGRVAGATYARVEVPARAVVLCPNHTGFGAMVSLWPDGAWNMPFGPVPIDGELTAALRSLPMVQEDRAAHRHEHALEVQLPFLFARRRDVAIAALCLGPLSADEAIQLGETVADAVRARPALLVASSDMSHYVSAEEAREKDHRALDRF